MSRRSTSHRWRGERIALWLAAGALLFAPLAFGATTAGTRLALDIWMLLPAAVLLVHRAWRLPSREQIPLLWALGGLAVLGAVFLANPKFVFDARLQSLQPVGPSIPWLPGTYDLASSKPVVLHLLCLSVYLAALIHLCADPRNRWFLLRTVAVSGFVIALIGIYQKASGTTSMLWTSSDYKDRTFFAAFRYHGNAVAFLNLCWPAALALLLRTLRSSERNFLSTAWWANCLLFTAGAVLVNTSKFGHVALVPAIVGALLLFRRSLPPLRGSARANGIVIGILAVGFLAVLSLFSAEIVSSKWESTLHDAVSFKRRLLAYRAALSMCGDGWLTGFGPGTFGILFPYYSIFGGTELGGRWTFAHQDYLQTVAEWGAPGAAAIFFVFAGALLRLVAKHRRHRARSLTVSAALLAFTIVALHALVDFPLQIGAIQATMAVYLALGWSVDTSSPHRRPSRHGSARHPHPNALAVPGRRPSSAPDETGWADLFPEEPPPVRSAPPSSGTRPQRSGGR